MVYKMETTKKTNKNFKSNLDYIKFNAFNQEVSFIYSNRKETFKQNVFILV